MTYNDPAHRPAQPGPVPAPPPQWAPPQQYGYPAPYQQQPPGTNGLGVAGFVCGLIGLIFCWVPFFGLVLGVLGVIMGGAGIATAKKSNAGSGLAIAGLVCGVIAIVPAIIVIAALASVS
jgi:hypothetical protein